MLKKHIKSARLLLLLSGIPALTFAQREVATQNFANTTDGSPVSSIKYEDIKGSPYLTDDWSTGLVKLQSGKTYKEVKVKYDQVADELHFENKGEELVFINPISEFKLTLVTNGAANDLYFKNGFASDPKAFYQVLAEGKLSLIKKNRKVIVDKTPYTSATAIKVFEPQTKYYLYHNNKSEVVKNNKKSLLSALPNKRDAMEAYMQKENLDPKTDEDFSKLINYYNSL